MEVGTVVKIKILGRKKYWTRGKEYKKGKIEKIYPNYILVRLEDGSRECFFESELIKVEDSDE